MEMARTAQDAFTELVRDRIGPGLRSAGLKGSGRAWTLPSQTHWAVIGLQRSVHSDARELGFTINVQVVERQAWAAKRAESPYLPERPAPNTRYGAPVWQSRIGLLMPSRRDTWWTVTPTTDLARLSREIIEALDRYVLPEMRRQIAKG